MLTDNDLCPGKVDPEETEPRALKFGADLARPLEA
jgi:hypothetical protein